MSNTDTSSAEQTPTELTADEIAFIAGQGRCAVCGHLNVFHEADFDAPLGTWWCALCGTDPAVAGHSCDAVEDDELAGGGDETALTTAPPSRSTPV